MTERKEYFKQYYRGNRASILEKVNENRLKNEMTVESIQKYLDKLNAGAMRRISKKKLERYNINYNQKNNLYEIYNGQRCV